MIISFCEDQKGLALKFQYCILDLLLWGTYPLFFLISCLNAQNLIKGTQAQIPIKTSPIRGVHSALGKAYLRASPNPMKTSLHVAGHQCLGMVTKLCNNVSFRKYKFLFSAIRIPPIIYLSMMGTNPKLLIKKPFISSL